MKNVSGDDHYSEPPVQAPKQLIDDLQVLFKVSAAPQSLDEAVASMARHHFIGHRRLRLAVRWCGLGAAAAAVLIMAVWLIRPDGGKLASRSSMIATVDPHDIDGSGNVDILDAFALARRLQANDRAEIRWDLNRDGQVNEEDVDKIAQMAVRLENGG